MFFPFSDNVPARRTPVITYLIVVANAAVLLFATSRNTLDRELQVYRHGFIPARVAQIFNHQPLMIEFEVEVHDPHFQRPEVLVERVPLPADTFNIVSTVFSSMFMHAGWMHLLGNMWFLWIFGDNVEDRLGHGLYLCFYLLGGGLAAACHSFNDPASDVPVVGAGGAVAAILGAYIVTWPWARIRSLVFLFVFFTVIELPALVVLGLWFLTQVLQAQHDMGTGGGVAWWAHIGGFIAGAALMPLAREDEPSVPVIERRGDWEDRQ